MQMIVRWIIRERLEHDIIITPQRCLDIACEGIALRDRDIVAAKIERVTCGME